jgi:hypothetical protein
MPPLEYADSYFRDAYYKAHDSINPEINYTSYKNLEDKYINIWGFWMDMMTLSILSPEENLRASSGYIRSSSAMKNESKLLWLFYSSIFPNDSYGDFPLRMQRIVIEKNDINLSASDYILLTYLGYQTDELQKSFEGLPLSMIADMFAPIAEMNLEQWYDSKNVIRDL